MPQLGKVADAQLLATARAQLEDEYFERFRRPTDKDSPRQEFSSDLIYSVACRPDPVPTRLDYAKIALSALNTGKVLERRMSLLLMGFELTRSDKPMQLPQHLYSHYRRLMLEAADNPVALSPLTCAKLRTLLAGRIIGVPVPEIGPNGAHTAHRMVAANFETAFDYAALLLISDFSFQLRRCKLSSCRNLFLRERGVKNAQRDYCGDQCREAIRKKERKEQIYAKRVGVTVNEWRDILKKKGQDYKPKQFASDQQFLARTRK